MVRKVAVGGRISTFAGTGFCGDSGDGGPAINAHLCDPEYVAADPSGNILISDQSYSVIRSVSSSGTITTVAGNGTEGYSGDGGPATSAELRYPGPVLADASGDVFIADFYNFRTRKLSHSAIITTIAGNGYDNESGDNGQAASATLDYPEAVAVGPDGTVYISDSDNNVVRKVSTNGVITVFAGTGAAGYSGDNGPATAATFSQPWALLLTRVVMFTWSILTTARSARSLPAA